MLWGGGLWDQISIGGTRMSMQAESPIVSEKRWQRSRAWWGKYSTGEDAVEIQFYRGSETEVITLDSDAVRQLQIQLSAALGQQDKSRHLEEWEDHWERVKEIVRHLPRRP